MHAEPLSERPLLSLLTVLLLTSPAFLGTPASGGSALVEGPADFPGGTTMETAATGQGLRLARDESLIGNWTRMDGWPTPRYYHGMAYDSAAGVSVLFGGFDGTRCQNDTWTYNLSNNSWAQSAPAQSPPARESPAMAFDSRSGVVVLFGGDNGSNALNDTWTYDTSSDTWTKKNPASPPAAQMSESYEMVFSDADREMVLFGGGNQTWTYNVSSNVWARMAADPSPPGRQYHSLAYDSARQVVVLFGGAAGGTARNDTWTYSVAQNLWANVTPAGSPRPRTGHGMAYDSSAGKLVVFSGYDEYGLILNDTWTFDAATSAWSSMGPAPFPNPRCYYGLDFDAAAGETVLFGGASFSWRNEDTWTYNATSNAWSRRTPAPGERIYSSFSYDGSARLAVLFGGNDPSTHFSDTWAYDYRGNLWTEKRPASAPPARAGGALVFDAADGRSILFGGRWGPAAWQTLGDTWAYDAGTNSWAELKPAQAPTARAFHSMACDPASGLVVLYGGWGEFGITNDTWVYNLSANAWTQKYPGSSPPARQEAAMAFDAGSGLFVLFGGVAASDLKDTWTYNISSNVWTKMSPGKSPSARLASMVAAGGGLVLVGGCSSDLTRVFNETWTYDVQADKWAEQNPLPWAAGRARMGLAADGESGVVVLFGGGYDGHHGDTWVYSLNRYSPAGGFVSRPLELGGPAAFSSIEWTADVPATTLLAFQVRSAATAEGLDLAGFVGPDGTADTYYSLSGERLYSGHNGSSWVQYRAGFTTTVPGDTPLLKAVRIPYNLPPEVSITAPVGQENWSGVQNITWDASDPDGDPLAFDLYLIYENLTGMPLRLNITNSTSFRWDTNSVPNGGYYIHLIARDGDPDAPLSGNYTSPLFRVTNRHPNRPPSATMVRPADGETIFSNRVTLEWTGSDEDGDNLAYYVFLALNPFDPQSAPSPYATTTSANYTEFALKKGATYTWTVLANDGQVNSTMAEIRTFTVVSNRPPVVELAEPADGDTVNTSAAALAWAGSDPDGDALTYEIHYAPYEFSAASLPPRMGTTRDSSFPALDLANGATYWWTVVPFDQETRGNAAPVRRFSVSVVVPVDSPRVIYHAPKGLGVAVKPTVLVTFDREMNTASVSEALNITPALKITDFVMVNTTFQVSLGAELEHNTTYEVLVRTSASSLDGRTLTVPYRWNFTTVAEGQKDTDLPYVAVTEPRNGATRVSPRSNITLMFSESMNMSATVRAVTFVPQLNASYRWLNTKGFALRYIPLGPMPNVTVQVTVSTESRDESGNPLLANYTFAFRVGFEIPRLVRREPAGKGIALNSTIRLEFDHPMNQSSLRSYVTVRPAVKGNWSLDDTLKNLTFQPAGKLRAGTRYSVSVSPSASDLEGEMLGNGTYWTFTTVAGPAQRTELPWMLILIAIVIAAAAAGGGALYLRRKRPAPKEATTSAAGAGSAGEAAGAADAADASGGPGGAQAGSGEAAGEAAAPGGALEAGASAPAFKLPATPEPFAVEDVFLLYRDGRLMKHIGQSAGEVSFPGVLAAVQELLKKVPERVEDAPPVTLKHGGKNVLFERGKWTAMAAVTTGPAPESFREEMLSQVRNVEAEVGAILPDWDGRQELLATPNAYVTTWPC